MSGSAQLTADGVVLTSGKPVRINGLRIKSGNGGPGTVTLYDGTDTSGTEKYTTTGNADGTYVAVFPPGGIFFASGCYCDIDANVTYVDFDVEKVQQA